MDSQKKLIENIKKVCICRGITAGKIMETIRSGNLSFESLRRTIGVGTGNCKARRCRTKIEQMVKDYKESAETKPADPHPQKQR